MPGSIQPHGVLLALDTKLNILQASTNAGTLFGVSIDRLLSHNLREINGALRFAELIGERARSIGEQPEYLGQFASYQVLAHAVDSILIVEFEPIAGSLSISFENLPTEIVRLTNRVQGTRETGELVSLTADLARSLTGFDWALIYKFADNGDGQVIGESRAAGVPSYLDLWFPAAHIPAQARKLTGRNPTRLIVDAGYKPLAIVPALNPETGRPLDLTHSTLRSVSPMHVEYMENVDTAASMSISILRHGELWGLISLHHRTPRFVPFEVRSACILLGMAFASQLKMFDTREDYERRLDLKAIVIRLLAFMAEEERFMDGLTKHPVELMALLKAQGAAVVIDGKMALLGRTPVESDVNRILAWLSDRGDEFYYTDHLASVIPEGESLRECAAGLLAISISKLRRSYVIWFRPEIVQTFSWGAGPHKTAESVPTDRIHPRKSFEIWKETVRGRSASWSVVETEAALDLRSAVIGIVLRKAEEIAALTILSAELERSNQELEAFSYSVSHDLRAPFRHILGYSDLLKEHLGAALDTKGQRLLTTISGSAESAAYMIEDLLNLSRVGRMDLTVITFDMNDLVADVRRTLRYNERERSIAWKVARLPFVCGDPILLRMVWENLLSNAVKFTSRRKDARISIDCEERTNEFVFSVSDNGAGFDQKQVDKLFGVFQRLHKDSEFEGNGIGLANVQRAVQKHGGQTWAEGEIDQGARFFFTMPKERKPEREAHAETDCVS